MNRSWWWKFAFLAFTVILSAVYIYPTLANLNPQTTKFPFKQKVNLGLDLQGGLYMVLGVDFDRLFREITDRQATGLQGRFAEKAIPVTGVTVVRDGFPADDPRISVKFDPAQRDKVHDLVKADYGFVLRGTGENPGVLEYGLSREYRSQVRDDTLNQSIEVIRNRIDEFGVTEPSIASQGTDRIVVELPGVREIERAKDLIGRTAKLEFKIVDDERMGQDKVIQLVDDIKKTNSLEYKEGEKFSEYSAKINQFAKGKIPEGDEIAFERMVAPGQAPQYVPYALISKAGATGDDLQDAQVSFDQQKNVPIVAFQMNPKGANAMGALTGANVGKRMAIVLDNTVYSAPVIQSQISSGGQITLGQGNYDKLMKEAKDLAIVLRAGALPAQLDFLEQRIVGPTLGQDSIRSGIMAGVIGSILVFCFISFYYKVSGLIAVVSLTMNVLFVLAILVGMEATLTLPGIAGIALTVGIAVDSNVVIYERIREEIHAGKGPHAAVDSGFQKAFRTILDANVTNAAAAVILMMYGTGPIKGFAVTMLIGIVTTLYTAVFVCKLFFDAYLSKLEQRQAKALSI